MHLRMETPSLTLLFLLGSLSSLWSCFPSSLILEAFSFCGFYFSLLPSPLCPGFYSVFSPLPSPLSLPCLSSILLLALPGSFSVFFSPACCLFSVLFSAFSTWGPPPLPSVTSYLLSTPVFCPRRPLADPPLLPRLPGWFQRALRGRLWRAVRSSSASCMSGGAGL